MSSGIAPAILGLGYKVPDHIRDNKDPIFDHLNDRARYRRSPFGGFEERRVLSRAQGLIDIMEPAALEALKTANTPPGDIDIMLGCASVSPNRGPSELTNLHKKLKLPDHALAETLGNDFSNFNMALVFADALIKAEPDPKKREKMRILIAIGGNWTRAVDYETNQAASAADGAAAAVIGLPDKNAAEWQKWQMVDQKAFVKSDNFGFMYLAGDPIPGQCGSRPAEEPRSARWTSPYFHITPGGGFEFYNFGKNGPATLGKKLLEDNNISGDEVTLIGHQASSALTGEWVRQIQPANFFTTIKKLANMTVATIPVNLALALLPEKEPDRREMGVKDVSTPYLLLLALGYDMHAHALLLGNSERIEKLKASA